MSEFNLPQMAINPPLPYSVYKQMAEQERFEALQEIADNAKLLAESAKSQADAANRQVIVLEQQLTFIKLEAESAKKRCAVLQVCVHCRHYHQYCCYRSTATSLMINAIALNTMAVSEIH